MNSQEVNVFEEIISPLVPLLEEEAINLGDDIKKYKFSLLPFTLNLLYGIINGIKTISLLITHLKSLPNINELPFMKASKSMYSEAFIRYEPIIFRRIFYKLLEKTNFLLIDEIKTLGRFYCVDGSVFPAIQTMMWASYKKTKNAIKLHLAFDLNRMIPVEFISTEANASERKMLLKMIEAGVTIIADRGYVCFNTFKEICLNRAYFIIRGKSNLLYEIKEILPIEIPDSWKSLVSEVKDFKVEFKNDKHSQHYRVVSFIALGESFLLITNRFDLKTHEVIMLYAYRWQVELIFRFFKRTLNALHLMSHDPRGIEIQFTLHMIAYLLLLSFKQRCNLEQENMEECNDINLGGSDLEQDNMEECNDVNLEENNIEKSKNIDNKVGIEFSSLNEQQSSKDNVCGLVSLLGKRLQKYWKIGIHWLTTIRNLLFEPFTPEIVKTICA
jgi:hypothetical protein